MQIKFSRSGGIGGALTNVGGTVELTADGGEVVANDGAYRRSLDAHEARELRSFVERAQAPEPDQPMRDTFQYDVSITAKDGKTRQLTIPQSAGHPQAITAELAGWLDKESRRILAHRVQAAAH